MSSELTQEHLNDEYFDEEYWINQEKVPVPDWHLAILEERMTRYKSEPVEWIPLEDIEKELMQEILEEIKRRKQ